MFEDGLFVAGYYLQREMRNQLLGPLRVSAYDSVSGRWLRAPALEEGGSVLTVHVSRPYVLLGLHGTPSSGTGLILDAKSLARVGAVAGGSLRPLARGGILFNAGLRHFAATHQDRLMVFDPQTGSEAEIFPGARLSALADAYRASVVRTYASLPAEVKAGYEQEVYGPITDFDRAIGVIVESRDGSRIAFDVEYRSSRLDSRQPRVAAVATCRRGTASAWQCDERPLETAASAVGVRLERVPDVGFAREPLEAMLRKVVESR